MAQCFEVCIGDQFQTMKRLERKYSWFWRECENKKLVTVHNWARFGGVFSSY